MPTYFHPPRVVVHCLSPDPHLNVKPSPGGSHLSLGGTNTISKHQSPQRHTLARCLLCARPLNLLLHTPKLFHEGALEGLSAVTANFANKKYIAPTACRLSDGDGMRVCVCVSLGRSECRCWLHSQRVCMCGCLHLRVQRLRPVSAGNRWNRLQ